MKTLKGYVTKNLITVTKTTPLSKAVKLMQRHKTGSLLVTVRKKPIGIFTERDLLSRLDFAQPEKLSSLLISDVLAINPPP